MGRLPSLNDLSDDQLNDYTYWGACAILILAAIGAVAVVVTTINVLDHYLG